MKLRRFRAVPTVEMLRTTWEKTTHPIVSLKQPIWFFSNSTFSKVRFITHLPLPRLSVRRKILLPRPKSSSYTRPIAAYLFFARPESELCKATDLILDCPGGGYVAMSPEHHEERLRKWAVTTGRPVLSLDYGKAPECELPSCFYMTLLSYALLERRSIPLRNRWGIWCLQTHDWNLYVPCHSEDKVR
jgi:acetyl esterase/lipase